MNLLRAIVCATALLAATTVADARAAGEDRTGASVSAKDKAGDSPEHVAARQQALARKPHLLSTNGWTEMMLKDDAVYVQLTDYGIKQVGEPQETRKSEEGFFSNIIKSMALSGVKELLNHSLALSLTDMRSAIARDGAVVLVTCQGKEVFNKIKFNDEVQKFPQDRADDFVKDVNRQRQRLPACRA